MNTGNTAGSAAPAGASEYPPLPAVERSARCPWSACASAAGAPLRSLYRPQTDLQGADRMTTKEQPKPPAVLDAIADKVLAYRPKPKSKPAKKRARTQKKLALESSI